ncbi:hypothetical protein BpHYR1_021146 [Brachionus plicatilis]|uniref:HAT C-terminal dimerisation domain-containing protein n=1 Tax=Brachionus plicatilis TaxID=10195 RepID=A0A3M7PLZ2_BRAPC|nr:hypothetical protein BpHYR1_021146 [Brachionus plicatilis]
MVLQLIRFLSLLIYCVTAISVTSENLFSNAGLVQNDQRNRMEPSALNMVFNILSKLNAEK